VQLVAKFSIFLLLAQSRPDTCEKRIRASNLLMLKITRQRERSRKQQVNNVEIIHGGFTVHVLRAVRSRSATLMGTPDGASPRISTRIVRVREYGSLEMADIM
jgi:hypothetical protein